MKLGLVSAILEELSFEEMIDFVSEIGLECVEVACWPKGEAERRYAGVSHIDVNDLRQERWITFCGTARTEKWRSQPLPFIPMCWIPMQKKERQISGTFIR